MYASDTLLGLKSSSFYTVTDTDVFSLLRTSYANRRRVRLPVGGAMSPTTGEIVSRSPDAFVRSLGSAYAMQLYSLQVAAVLGHTVVFLPEALRFRTRTLFSCSRYYVP